jgi:hypothetical protein
MVPPPRLLEINTKNVQNFGLRGKGTVMTLIEVRISMQNAELGLGGKGENS